MFSDPNTGFLKGFDLDLLHEGKEMLAFWLV
jgi:hypothetical protein